MKTAARRSSLTLLPGAGNALLHSREPTSTISWRWFLITRSAKLRPSKRRFTKTGEFPGARTAKRKGPSPSLFRGARFKAGLALFFNLVILLGFLGFSGATLTLPGIAGVILTIGMGVDSNVLIFERIREELRNGKTPPSAVEQGFGHAWVTIVDTHVTTIVSAIILFLFGTGPVKGFAVTLSFGLFANLFTAVFVSRVIFDWVLSRKQRGEALSIG